MDSLAGRNLVDRINREVINSAHVYCHHWQPDGVMHRARPFDTANDRRVVRRCTVIGDAPY
jgi:alpha-ketoglutarate-dependent taurine dioxygenase